MINQHGNTGRISSTGPELGNEPREPIISLWTVPERWGGTFFVLLVMQGTVLVGLHAWRRIVTAQHAYIVDTLLEEAPVATPMFVLAGILSMIELEAALTLSVWYENRVRRKEAEWRAEIERKDAEMREKMRDEIREEIWDEAFAEGRRAERERTEWLTATRERARRYPYV